MDDELLPILDIQSLVWLAVQHTSLQVEVADCAISIESSDGGLDAGGSAVRGCCLLIGKTKDLIRRYSRASSV